MAERSRRITDQRRLIGAVVLVAALGVALVACSDDERTREHCGGGAACAAPSTTTPTPATPVDIQLRPVLSADPASVANNPCPTDLPAPAPTETVEAPGCKGAVIDTLYGLGPSAVDGSAFESASATQNGNTGEWVVNPVLKQGATGIDLFNAAAAHCYAKDATCPTGQLAIVVDGVVLSAPAIQQPHFEADQIQITGAPFTEASATALATGIEASG